jgi:hypothetical protein
VSANITLPRGPWSSPLVVPLTSILSTAALVVSSFIGFNWFGSLKTLVGKVSLYAGACDRAPARRHFHLGEIPGFGKSTYRPRREIQSICDFCAHQEQRKLRGVVLHGVQILSGSRIAVSAVMVIVI